MKREALGALQSTARWTCTQCQQKTRQHLHRAFLLSQSSRRTFGSSRQQRADVQVQAAPEIDFENPTFARPARLLPASSSYFTTTPVFNDYILKVRRFVGEYGSLPAVSPEQAPQVSWMTLTQFRASAGERIGAAKYSALVVLLRRLNLIHPQLRPQEVTEIIERFRRPGVPEATKAKPQTIDEYGRSKGIGRRKSSTAKVLLVEGTGEILVNGKSLHESFPRIHDRESAMWPLKITNRIDKYNAFILTSGGGLTGQAESITLGMAKALIVQEPALKPALRKGQFILHTSSTPTYFVQLVALLES